MGPDDNARKRADMLAGLGYVAFAADLYGKGVRPKSTEAAMRAFFDEIFAARKKR